MYSKEQNSLLRAVIRLPYEEKEDPIRVRITVD
jgi:hypothetical protein